MFEAFSVITAVPGAIDATLNIIGKIRDALKKTGGESELESELQVALDQLKSAKDSLKEFTISFDELEAWKEIHHISNMLRNNLKKSFEYVARALDRYDFERNVYDISVKGDMLADIHGLDDEHQAGTLLVKYEMKTTIHKHLMILKNIDEEDKEWHDRTRELINRIKDVVDDGAAQKIYDAFSDFSRHINLCNTLADDKIIEGISKYNDVISELRKALQ